jgi:putative ABC transport system permease protein
MKTALWKDFFREVRRSHSRFISIFAIVFIGVGFFAGIKATAPDMKNSMDIYYDEYNLMDIRIMSTLGLTKDDINAITATSQIEAIQPGYFTDVISTVNSTEFVFTVHSLPSDKIKNPNNDYINAIKLTEGRYPEKSGECVIESSSLMDTGLSVGDTIKVNSGKTKSITDGTLVTDEFKIVGKTITPYYLSFEKGPSEIGSGKVNFYMMILDKDFTIPVYTEALVTVKNVKQLNSFSDKYKKLVSQVVTPLENLGEDRSTIRLAEVKKMAMDELGKNKQEFESQKQLFIDEIKKAEEDLNQAKMQLVAGEAKLETERKNFNENYIQASKQISDGEVQLAQGRVKYEQGLADYNNAMSEHGKDIENLNNTTQDINNLRGQANSQIEELSKSLNDPNVSEEDKESTKQLIQLYQSFLSIMDLGINPLNELNVFAQGTVIRSKSDLDSAKKELDQKSAELAAAKKKLKDGKSQANNEFASAEKELTQGTADYENGKIQLEKEKADGQKKLDEGQEKIIRAEDEIDKISKPKWYVLDRNSNYSYVDYEKTADRIDSIAKIFPVFFFLVASLVCLTTMTRMVDEQRGSIGAYKALGYGNKSIALKYVLYAAIASLFGGILGLCLGMKIFPAVIYNAWSMMYTLPKLSTVIQIPLMFISVLIGVLVTTLSVLGACYKELGETPSLLMLPKSPKPGKRIFLERISLVWNRLTFSQKVTSRNLFRYKKRLFMTIIGIAGCSALLLAGFGLSNSISQIVNKQYNEIFTYDLNMNYKPGTTEEDKVRVMNTLKDYSNVKSYLPGSKLNAKVKNGEHDISLTLIVPSDNNDFQNYITLRERTTGKPINIPEKGFIINEKLAKELNVHIGDVIELDNGDGATKKVEISGITENYVFHYAYMSAAYYKEIYRLAPKSNNLMIKLNQTSADAESNLGSILIKDNSVASVEFYSLAADKFNDTVKILNNIVIVIIMSAGLLAFVVLYNLTNINIGERIREIATIKVLGFYNNEVSSYVYRENMLLSIIGSSVGLLIGIILHRFIMVSIEQDGIMFGNHIDGISFLYSFLITLGFVILVNIFMYRRLTKIPMVESLKSVE